MASVVDYGASPGSEGTWNSSAFAAAVAANDVVTIPRGTWKLSERWMVPAGVSIIADGAVLHWVDEFNRGMCVGTPGVKNSYVDVTGLRLQSKLAWHAGDCGIELINPVESEIRIRGVEGFTTGVKITSDVLAYYNEVAARSLRGCQTGLWLSGQGGAINSNRFGLGQPSVRSLSSQPAGPVVGVKIASEPGFTGHHNRNRFIGFAMEVGSHPESRAISVECGATRNKFADCSHEANGPLVAVYEAPGATMNRYEFSWYSTGTFKHDANSTSTISSQENVQPVHEVY